MMHGMVQERNIIARCFCLEAEPPSPLVMLCGGSLCSSTISQLCKARGVVEHAVQGNLGMKAMFARLGCVLCFASKVPALKLPGSAALVMLPLAIQTSVESLVGRFGVGITFVGLHVVEEKACLRRCIQDEVVPPSSEI